MTLLEWKEQYSLGNEALDHEHKELIGLINAVHEKIERAGEEDNQARILDGLTEIQNAVGAHFALEEKEMVILKYQNFPAHKADHEKLLDEICDLVETVEDADVHDIRESLSGILEAWFSIHFQTFDRDFHLAIRPSN